jgi:outer membrane biosynthesis protein TonB
VRWSAFILLCALGVMLPPPPPGTYAPARYESGAVPALPALVVGGGQVILELTVGPAGRVTSLTPLRTTPPFTTVVSDAVREWRFAPATMTTADGSEGATDRPSPAPVESHVLVVATFRPPALNTPTLGEAPKDVALPSSSMAFPLKMPAPSFPPQAFGGGVVLMEARVDNDGRAADLRVLHSSPPFDDAVRTVLGNWDFRPARVGGTPVPTFVYLLFGFPVPVGSARGAF